MISAMRVCTHGGRTGQGAHADGYKSCRANIHRNTNLGSKVTLQFRVNGLLHNCGWLGGHEEYGNVQMHAGTICTSHLIICRSVVIQTRHTCLQPHAQHLICGVTVSIASMRPVSTSTDMLHARTCLLPMQRHH